MHIACLQEPAQHYQLTQHEQGQRGSWDKSGGDPLQRVTEQSSPVEKTVRWLGANVSPSPWPCARAGSSDSASGATAEAAAGKGCGRIGPWQDAHMRGGSQQQG